MDGIGESETWIKVCHTFLVFFPNSSTHRAVVCSLALCRMSLLEVSIFAMLDSVSLSHYTISYLGEKELLQEPCGWCNVRTTPFLETWTFRVRILELKKLQNFLPQSNELLQSGHVKFCLISVCGSLKSSLVLHECFLF